MLLDLNQMIIKKLWIHIGLVYALCLSCVKGKTLTVGHGVNYDSELNYVSEHLKKNLQHSHISHILQKTKNRHDYQRMIVFVLYSQLSIVCLECLF